MTTAQDRELDERLDKMMSDFVEENIASGKIKLEIGPTKFRHKVTGEIVTQFNIRDIGKYEKVVDRPEPKSELERMLRHAFEEEE